MRAYILASLSLLPFAARAFAPPSSALRVTPISLNNQVTDVLDDGTAKVEEALSKADSLVLGRAMRVVDHAPILFTLKCLGGNLASASSNVFGVGAVATETGAGIATALALPAYMGYLWPAIAACQVASVAKSVLADGGNELSQSDINGITAANFFAAAALGNPCLKALVLSSVVSGYLSRQAGGTEDITIHNASLQLMTGLTTVAAIGASIAKVASFVPFLDGKAEVVTALGLVGFYMNAVRKGNNKSKIAINAAAIGGILWSRIASGGLALTLSSIISTSTVTLVGTAYVAYEAIKRAKDII